MIYEVLLSLEAVEDVLRITLASGAKSEALPGSGLVFGVGEG